MPSEIRILVVRFSSLGDVVLTTPLLRGLRRRFPEAVVTYATKEVYAPLLRGNPAVDRVVPLEKAETVGSFAARLGSHELGIDLHGSLRSWALRRLVPARWRRYRKQRFRRAALVHCGVDLYRDRGSVAERYFDALAGLDITPDGRPPEVFVPDSGRTEAATIVSRGAVVLAPGARHATKRWPAERWRRLGRSLLDGGYKVVGVGAAGEELLLDGLDVPKAFGRPIEIVAAILQRAGTVVANDSGLMHLATAVSTPVVSLFGPTVSQFGFSPYSPDATVIECDLSCRPCSYNGSSRCRKGHHACLERISPERVISAISAA